MALDEALVESVRAGAPPVLRFYRWSPACLSFGRNQPARGLYDADRIARLGLDVVRRPTGGRAVLHARELTYSVIVEDRRLGGPRESYLAINRALAAGLHRLGVPVQVQGRSAGRAPIPSTTPCFQEPAEGELVVAGRKLVGSAQCRTRGMLLQHGSLLLENDQALLAELGPATTSPDAPPGVLSDHLSPLPTWETLTHALADGWRSVLGGNLEPAAATARELQLAERLLPRHTDLEWIWRR